MRAQKCTMNMILGQVLEEGYVYMLIDDYERPEKGHYAC